MRHGVSSEDSRDRRTQVDPGEARARTAARSSPGRPRVDLPAASLADRAAGYHRRRPETTALYEVVRDNLETLYGAIDDGALDGLLCRGFARLRCGACDESRLVA
jgi:hypothetical protein